MYETIWQTPSSYRHHTTHVYDRHEYRYKPNGTDEVHKELSQDRRHDCKPHETYAGSGIIIQHCAHLFFVESGHFIKFRRERIIGSDIESAGEIVHCDGADTCHEATFDSGVRACFHRIEEAAQITGSVCLALVSSRQAGSDKILFVKWSYSSMNR